MLDPCGDAMVAERNSIVKIRNAFVMAPRPGVPMSQWEELSSLIDTFEFHEHPDRFVWDLDMTGEFAVSSVRHYLDMVMLRTDGVKTRWNNFVPKKLNILMWRIAKNRIPTRMNLHDRGIELDSLLCPGCKTIGESAAHLFASCTELLPLWVRIASWLAVPPPSTMTIASLTRWADGLVLPPNSKKKF